MTRQLASITAALILQSCGGLRHDYHSVDWGVSASFPREAQEQPWSLKTPNGVLGGTVVLTPMNRPERGLYVLFMLFVPNGFDRDVAASSFEQEVTMGVGEVVSRTEGTFGSVPATDVAVEGVEMKRLRHTIVGQRLIAAMGPESGAFLAPPAAAFLNSVVIHLEWAEKKYADDPHPVYRP